MKNLSRVLSYGFFAIFVLLLSGCISHKFFVDFSADPVVYYRVEGDSLDMFDGRLTYPGEPWKEILRDREKAEDGTITWKLEFQGKLENTLSHSVHPGEKSPILYRKEQNLLVIKRKEFVAEFPGWDVIEEYGDLRQFVPEEVEILEKPGMDTILSEDKVTELQRLEAIGLQKATARRYMYQMHNMLKSWIIDNKIDSTRDSLLIRDALERFSGVLHAHMLTNREQDPVEVTLEWYPDLRDNMITIAQEVTGGSERYFTHIADSIDFRWKTWLDMEDDNLQLSLIFPATWINAEPDSMSGDTLIWLFDGTEFENEGVVIKVVGWQVEIFAYIVIIILGLGLGVLIGIRFRKRQTES